MPPKLEPQLAMDEQAITNADLEAALEHRLRVTDDVAEAKGVKKTADEAVNTLLATIPFEPGTALRVGRFRITKTHLEGGVVSFERKASDRIQIGLAEEAKASPERKPKSVSDDEDLRPTGEVNADALRGIADRSSEPTPIKRNGSQPPASLS